METEPLITVIEAASLLRVKPSWIYANADFLGAYRLGKYLRFSQQEILKRLRERGAPGLGSQPNDSPQGR